MSVIENLKHLLWYKQEHICYSRWQTIANSYLRLLLLGSSGLYAEEKSKLSRFASYIESAYLPSFLMMPLEPKASEGLLPALLCQRDLLVAYEQVHSFVFIKVVNHYFIQHASSCFHLVILI